MFWAIAIAIGILAAGIMSWPMLRQGAAYPKLCPGPGAGGTDHLFVLVPAGWHTRWNRCDRNSTTATTTTAGRSCK